MNRGRRGCPRDLQIAIWTSGIFPWPISSSPWCESTTSRLAIAAFWSVFLSLHLLMSSSELDIPWARLTMRTAFRHTRLFGAARVEMLRDDDLSRNDVVVGVHEHRCASVSHSTTALSDCSTVWMNDSHTSSHALPPSPLPYCSALLLYSPIQVPRALWCFHFHWILPNGEGCVSIQGRHTRCVNTPNVSF